MGEVGGGCSGRMEIENYLRRRVVESTKIPASECVDSDLRFSAFLYRCNVTHRIASQSAWVCVETHTSVG